jgi:flagellar protein FlbD
MVVNVDQIVTIEQTPDTIITLVNGDKLLVRESLGELVERTVAFHRRATGVPGADVTPTHEGDHAA